MIEYRRAHADIGSAGPTFPLCEHCGAICPGTWVKVILSSAEEFAFHEECLATTFPFVNAFRPFREPKAAVK